MVRRAIPIARSNWGSTPSQPGPPDPLPPYLSTNIQALQWPHSPRAAADKPVLATALN